MPLKGYEINGYQPQHFPSTSIASWCIELYCQTDGLQDFKLGGVASYLGCVGGEKRPGIDCLRMRDHSQKNLGICLRLEIVGIINTHTSGIFLYHQKVQPFASRITFNSMNEEDNGRVYGAKDAFLRLPTSFGKSARYKVLSFACLTVNKASWVQGGGSYLVSLAVGVTYDCQI